MNYPTIDPVAFTLGPLAVRWYGLSYLVGILGAWWGIRRRFPNEPEGWYDDLLFFAVLGVILGGRLGYVLFYQPHQLWTNPAFLFQIWQPGMSFHGGFLGVLLAMGLLARKYQQSFWSVTDKLAIFVPIGLASGRIGNFLNGELMGRVTDWPWGMIYPGVDGLRHPWPLYAVLGEGLLLFGLLWGFAQKSRPLGQISAVFLMGYGTIRFLEEYFREPDAHLGFILWDTLSMGQVLSAPLVVLGAGFYWLTTRRSTE